MVQCTLPSTVLIEQIILQVSHGRKGLKTADQAAATAGGALVSARVRSTADMALHQCQASALLEDLCLKPLFYSISHAVENHAASDQNPPLKP